MALDLLRILVFLWRGGRAMSAWDDLGKLSWWEWVKLLVSAALILPTVWFVLTLILLRFGEGG